MASPVPALDYEIKVSARARRVTLRVLAGRGLVVTIPRHFARRDVAPLVERHRQWAEQSLAELEDAVAPEHRQWPPRTLLLKALSRKLRVQFDTDPSCMRPRATWLSSSELRVRAAVQDTPQVASAIAEALKREARASLLAQLAFLSSHHRLSYQKAVIRGQRSVWGSYSSSGTLSLNYKLLFLTPELVEYVMLHELAHTRHLDHSKAFWQLLESLTPGAKSLDRQLSRASVMVPPWLERVR